MSARSVRRPLLAGAVLLSLATCPLVEQQTAAVARTTASVAAGARLAVPAAKPVALQPVSGTGLLKQRHRQAGAAPISKAAAAKAAKLARTAEAAKKRSVAAKVATGESAADSRAVLAADPADTQAGSAAEVALAFALDQLGKPYVWGAEGPDSYDCSGLTMAAYEAAGYQLPRTAAEQAMVGTPVDVADLLPGDLLFYATDPNDLSTVHHVVMYAGAGMVVQAPHQGDVVSLGPMWLGDEYAGAVRIVGAEPDTSETVATSTATAQTTPAGASKHTTHTKPTSTSTKSPAASHHSKPGSPSGSAGVPTTAVTPTPLPSTTSTTPISGSTPTSGSAPWLPELPPIVVEDPLPPSLPSSSPTPTPTPSATPIGVPIPTELPTLVPTPNPATTPPASALPGSPSPIVTVTNNPGLGL